MVTWDELFRKGDFAAREPTWSVRRFAALLAERGAKRVLDLGCGAGRHVVFLAWKGFEVHGLDSSAEALRICRERLREAGLRARNTTCLPAPHPRSSTRFAPRSARSAANRRTDQVGSRAAKSPFLKSSSHVTITPPLPSAHDEGGTA